MAAFLIVLIIGFVLYQLTKKEDHSMAAARKVKPTFEEGTGYVYPAWVIKRYAEEQQEEERMREIEETHFYDTYYQRWVVLQPDGSFVLRDTGEPIDTGILISWSEYPGYKRNLDEGVYDIEDDEEDIEDEDTEDEEEEFNFPIHKLTEEEQRQLTQRYDNDEYFREFVDAQLKAMNIPQNNKSDNQSN